MSELKPELGQYFTTNIYLKNIVKSLIKNTDGIVLEPSFGQGDLIKLVPDRIVHGYEIDRSIPRKFKITKSRKVFYTDFLDAKITTRYATIIGNPPYVKTDSGNLYLHFIDKCINLLDDNGELIFIVPSDFLKATRAADTINYMFENGYFTHFYLPNQEDLFKNASIDVVIFRYIKTTIPGTGFCLVNNIQSPISNIDGMILFEKDSGISIEDLFDVYVGIVSGKDGVFQNDTLGNVTIKTDFDKSSKFILIEKFPTKRKITNTYLLEHKEELLSRRIRKFNEDNWYEWGALRNIQQIKNNIGRLCIYVRCITRKTPIAQMGHVELFGGSLLCLIPHDDEMSEELLESIVEQINNKSSQYMYSGRFKITHKQISNMRIQLLD